MRKFFAVMAMIALLSPALAMADGRGGRHHRHHDVDITNTNRNNIDIQNSNRNTNKNTNLNLNKNTNLNYNTNKNTNLNTNLNTNVNTNLNTNKQNQNQGQYQGQYQGQGQSQVGVNTQKNSNNARQATDVTVEGDTYIAADIPVSTATGPSLTSGDDTCMGSTSIGGQGMSFGFSLGTTWIDRNCIRLKNANALNRMGHANAALALLAIDDDVAAALKATGVSYVSLDEVIKERVAVTLAEVHPGATFDKSNTYYGIDFEQID